MWAPAGADVWTPLRGVLTNMIPPTSIENDGDTMALLELQNSTIYAGTYAVPLKGMMDRLYWIVNSTAKASVQEIVLKTFTPNNNDWQTTYVHELATDMYRGSGYMIVQREPPAKDPKNMKFSPGIDLPQAQCFAGYNPTKESGPGSIGRGSGTSGVYWYVHVWTFTDYLQREGRGGEGGNESD